MLKLLCQVVCVCVPTALVPQWLKQSSTVATEKLLLWQRYHFLYCKWGLGGWADKLISIFQTSIFDKLVSNHAVACCVDQQFKLDVH